MGAKPAKQDVRNETNFKSEGIATSDTPCTIQPSYTYSYPYATQQQTYSNMACMAQQQSMAVQPSGHLQPTMASNTHIQATLFKVAPAYPTSQSVAFDHWQFNPRQTFNKPYITSTHTTQPQPRRTPFIEHHQTKYSSCHLPSIMPMSSQMIASTPHPLPPPPPQAHIQPSTSHHHQISTTSYPLHLIPIHQHHQHHQHYITSYIPNRRNSASTITSSKSSSSSSSSSFSSIS